MSPPPRIHVSPIFCFVRVISIRQKFELLPVFHFICPETFFILFFFFFHLSQRHIDIFIYIYIYTETHTISRKYVDNYYFFFILFNSIDTFHGLISCQNLSEVVCMITGTKMAPIISMNLLALNQVKSENDEHHLHHKRLNFLMHTLIKIHIQPVRQFK